MIVHPVISQVRTGNVVYFTPLPLTSNNDQGLGKQRSACSLVQKIRLEPVLLNYLLPETVYGVVSIANRGGRYTRHETDFVKKLGSELQVRSHICACRCNGPWIDSPPIDFHGLHLICSFVSRSPYPVVGVSVTIVISVRVKLDAQLFH